MFALVYQNTHTHSVKGGKSGVQTHVSDVWKHSDAPNVA